MNNQASMEHLQQLNPSKDKLKNNHRRKNSEALTQNTKRFLQAVATQQTQNKNLTNRKKPNNIIAKQFNGPTRNNLNVRKGANSGLEAHVFYETEKIHE